jgi:hypothetical protein
VEAVVLGVVVDDDALGEVVVDEALGEVVDDDELGAVVDDDPLGVEGVLVAAGGEEVDGEALGVVDVCASAVVNASVLTAAMAMTCFNMSASWGDLSEWFRSPAAMPASCMGNADRPCRFRVPRRKGAIMIAAA